MIAAEDSIIVLDTLFKPRIHRELLDYSESQVKPMNHNLKLSTHIIAYMRECT